MKPIMIIVADSVVARIFTAETTRSPLVEINTLTHSEGRLHDRDLTSDLSGKAAGSSGAGGHAYTPSTDPKAFELRDFVKQIANYVESARKANQVSSLLLVAAPTMLGELRNNLSDESKKLIVFSLGKHMTDQRAADVRSHLSDYLLDESPLTVE